MAASRWRISATLRQFDMAEICIKDVPRRMVLTNYSVPSSSTFDDVVIPANENRIYLEFIGPNGVNVALSFGPFVSGKPAYSLRAGERLVFKDIVPMGDVYLRTDTAVNVGAFEGVPYEET